MDWDGVFTGDLWPVAQGFQSFQAPLSHPGGFTPFFECFHGVRTTLVLLHAHRKHLAGLEITRGAAGNRQHHAAADIRHHRCELAEGVVPHLLEITVSNKRCFNSWHRITQLREWDRLPVVELLAIRPPPFRWRA